MTARSRTWRLLMAGRDEGGRLCAAANMHHLGLDDDQRMAKRLRVPHVGDPGPPGPGSHHLPDRGSPLTQPHAVPVVAPAGIVLVVDDTEENRYVTARWLERAGHRVTLASTGAEALRLATGEVDLVVLDVHLPDLHGFDVARRIRSDPNTAHLPVIHLSAKLVTLEDRISGLEAGANAYLAQPVSPDELVATVDALLRLSRVER